MFFVKIPCLKYCSRGGGWAWAFGFCVRFVIVVQCLQCRTRVADNVLQICEGADF